MKLRFYGMMLAVAVAASPVVAQSENADKDSQWELANPGKHFLEFSTSPSMTGMRKEVYVRDLGEGNYQFTHYVRTRKIPKTVNVVQSKDCKPALDYLKQLPQLANQQGYIPGITNSVPETIVLDGTSYVMRFAASINPSGMMQKMNTPLLLTSRGRDSLSSWINRMNGALERCAKV